MGALAPVVAFRVPSWDSYFRLCDEHHNRPAPRDATIEPLDSQRTFFITTVTWQRTPIFRADVRARLLIETLLDYRAQKKYLLHEFVVMPDHVHILLTPSPEMSLERAVRFVKGGYSYRLGQEEKLKIWQPSFTNHRIRDSNDYQRHCEYIRLNPVRARFVVEAARYPYSSANLAFGLDGAPPGLKPNLGKSA